MEITLTVTPEKLRQQVLSVRALIDETENELNNIEDIFSRSKGYWSGAAGDKARSEFEALKEDTAEILKSLRAYPSDLLAMADIYAGNEENHKLKNESLSADIIA